jgi:hypothetical protein
LLATEAKRKGEDFIAGATSLWLPRGGPMAKAERRRCADVAPAFNADAMAAIVPGAGRSRVGLFL